MTETRSKLVDISNILVVGIAIGFVCGYFFARRIHHSDGQSHVLEYVGEARHVDLSTEGSFEVTYSQPYTNPPELQILTEEMNRAFDYEILEQRNDGFRIKIGSSPGSQNRLDGSPWLRFRVKGSVMNLVRT